MKFSVCVLCYGDYPGLAERCLASVVNSAAWQQLQDLRIGLNETSAATGKVVDLFAARAARHVPTALFTPARNVGKYPLMRRMFYRAGQPLAPGVVWFDDDSYVVLAVPELYWWGELAASLDQADVVGSLYRLRGGLLPGQREAIQRQPWFTGQAMPPRMAPVFATGGFWAARSALLAQWDYPFPEIHHNGGDTVLGELCHQQGYRLKQFRHGVAINYDASRGGESRAYRRGLTTSLPWHDYRPGVPPDLGHQDFDCEVTWL